MNWFPARYRLLRLLKTGDPIVMLNVARNQKPEALPELNKAQNAALLRALAKTPEERFGSCSEFIEALDDGKVQKPRIIAKELQMKSGGRRFVGAAAAAVLAVGGFFWWQGRVGSPSRPNDEAARPAVEPCQSFV